MKKVLFLLAVMFSLLVAGCGAVPGITDGIKNVNDSIQNVNKAVDDVNKSIQDAQSQLSPDKKDSGSEEASAKDNSNEPDEESEED